MLKVGIIGCGKIADLHAQHIQRIPISEIIAVILIVHWFWQFLAD